MEPAEFHNLLLALARSAGFPLARGVDIDLALPQLSPHLAEFDRWLAAGFGSDLPYLERGRHKRADPRVLLPSAQSIFCVVSPYPREPAGAPSSLEGPRYARYLRGEDYHLTVAKRLEGMMEEAVHEWSKTERSALQWKVCVDSSAILEKSWAALAGLGWIGRNRLLITQDYGTYLVLGEVLISQKTGQAPQPLNNHCGECRRCLSKCPTQALMDSGIRPCRCISYLTLENRKQWALPDKERALTGTWIAGCDLCQEACPFNQSPRVPPPALPEDEGAISLCHWRELLEETDEQYRARIAGSALGRIKPAQFRRNLAIALDNAMAEMNQDERERFFTPRQISTRRAR